MEELVTPELTIEEWADWIRDPFGFLRCPTDGCPVLAVAHWDGVNETIRWQHCGHRAFSPENPSPWPPPDTHIRR